MSNVLDPNTIDVNSIQWDNPTPQDTNQILSASSDVKPQGIQGQPLDASKIVWDEDVYGTPTQTAIAGIEGLASGLLGPIPTAVEVASGITTPEAIERRRETNPNVYMGAQATGLVAPALLTFGTSALARAGVVGAAEALPVITSASKFTQAAALDSLATGAMKTLGIGEGAGAIAKIGSMAVKGAIENAAFQTGEEVTKQILHPDFSTEAATNAMIDIGGAGAIGFLLGGGIGAVSEGWQKINGPKTSGVLNAIKSRLGGGDEIVSDHVAEAVQRLGLDVEPEIMASLADDPQIRQMASILNQTDTTKSGLEFQEAAKKFVNTLDKKIVTTLGKDPELLTHEFSQSSAGNKIGLTLAEEYQEKIGPIAQRFEETQAKYSKAELGADLFNKEKQAAEIRLEIQDKIDRTNRQLKKALKTQSVDTAIELEAELASLRQQVKEVNQAAKIPGVQDIIVDDLHKLIERESWRGSDDIMKEVNRVIKAVPEFKTIGDITKQITTVGNNTFPKDTFTQTPLSRAGSLIKNILKEAEITAVAKALGKNEGMEAMHAFNANRQAFAQVAKLRDILDDRLNLRKSTSGYAKELKAAATSDGAAIYNKLSGRGDAELLPFLQENFPRTAQEIKDAFRENLLANAARGAEKDRVINRTVLEKSLKTLESKTPELSKFAIDAKTRADIEAIQSLAKQFEDATHNYSNTGRTVDKLLSDKIHTVTAMAAGLMSHDPATAVVVGYLTKALSKNVPDAVRLSLLKFLGSNKPINSGAFKAMIDFAEAVSKGESVTTKAVKNLFQTGAKVLPAQYETTENQRKKLVKESKKISENPAMLLEQKNKHTYYMPEISQTLTAAGVRIAQYINSIEPKEIQPGILDKKIAPSPMEVAAFNRALNIANQPLTVLEHIKNGTLVPSDMQHLLATHPEAYNMISQKIMNEIVKTSEHNKMIPYHMRQSLSLFMGQALDATLKPESIQSIQSTFGQEGKQQMPAGVPQAPKPKRSTAPLGHISKHLMTSDQAREARRNK